ncbi:IS3 family transposase [Pediococcus inopinatus]|uniref:IS3 family transposase n=2 Tax=Lactobacillaceae TaxID=33958 RepID=UPI0007C49F74|nr:IS3 family transposase [Pediococcus inopinatus]AVK99442.1 integrase [Pediococcus inopinatus]AVL00437.1 integrase [Pediococcus inopinatus]AVL00477.1 integrase [Pediococcus inopinatus]WPC16821.1 IS3 family transposase [Pediococcus inopinatus]WPC17077.1 IS3 family transposase [Pediococcus inopinatus]
MNKQHRLAYQAISEVSQGKQGAVTKLLKVVGVSRQAYYKGINRQITSWERQDKVLKERVQYWFDFHFQGIGAGNLLTNLEKDNQVTFAVTLKQVKRIMRELGLRCEIKVKKHNRVKQSDQYILDNTLNQSFKVTAPNQVWLSDSTELTYGVNGEHKVRLSGVLDLYGRKLLAYNLSLTETSAAEIQVFQRAFNQFSNAHPLIHTDRGSAYTSGAFNNYLARYNVTRSMSRPGTPYDNAPMERWWNEFKLRWMARHPLAKTYEELVKLVEDGIYYFNHHNRSAIRNGLTPDEYWNEAI